MDTYQPIYDAIRSRLSNGDIGEAVLTAFRNAGIEHYMARAASSIAQATSEYERPSVMMRPKLSIDGNKWIALYGDNLQDGVAGSGDSPAQAMGAFDIAWFTKLSQPPVSQGIPAVSTVTGGSPAGNDGGMGAANPVSNGGAQ
jgi:hypothetical protein